VVQPVLSVVGDVEIRPTIIVVVSDGYAETPAVVGYARLGSNIGKCAVAIIVEKRGMRRSRFTLQRILSRSVDEIDVEPAIIVIVQ
jgi:hypothetical protein